MLITFGILCLTAGINICVLMTIWVSNAYEKKILKEKEKIKNRT